MNILSMSHNKVKREQKQKLKKTGEINQENWEALFSKIMSTLLWMHLKRLLLLRIGKGTNLMLQCRKK